MELSHRRADTDKEKEEVIRRLLIAWKCLPELRLGQFLVCVVTGEPYFGDPFFIEDFDLVKAAEEYIKEK